MFGSLGIFQALFSGFIAAITALLGTTSDTYASNTLFGYAKYSGAIKSIQRGTISLTGTNLSGTATISAVTVAKTKLTFLGSTVDVNRIDCLPSIALTNTTTITATRAAYYQETVTATVSYEAVEYY